MEFQLIPSAGGPVARPVYLREDAYLVYAPKAAAVEVAGADRRLVIADTLTLVFAAGTGTFLSLDAYTRPIWWQPEASLALPQPAGRGQLRARGFPPGDDRFSLGIVPRYEVNWDTRLLRIVLGPEQAPTYYEVGANLLAGLRQGKLVDLFLSDLLFE